MAGYTHPATVERETKESIRQRLANLHRIEAAIRDQELAKEQHLARLYRERRRQLRASSYTPSPEALEYRDKYGPIIAAQPKPIHGGRAGLKAAADELEEHERRKRLHN